MEQVVIPIFGLITEDLQFKKVQTLSAAQTRYSKGHSDSMNLFKKESLFHQIPTENLISGNKRKLCPQIVLA
jgi:hypothetical protein